MKANRQRVMHCPCGNAKLIQQAHRQSRVDRTSHGSLRAYAADWRHFVAWCAEFDFSALPATPDTVALYMTSLAGTHRPVTITAA